MMFGYATRTVVQAGYFIIIARLLGPSGYGAFAAVVAIVAIVAPFSGVGTGNLLIQAVSRDPTEFSKRWGSAILITLASGSIILALLLAATMLLLASSFPPLLVLAVGIGDLLAARLLEASGQAFQAFHLLRRTAQLQALPMVLRLIAATSLLFVHAPSARLWGVLYAASMIMACATGLWLVRTELGLAVFDWTRARRGLRDGLHFSIGLGAQNIYNDIDKAMLARIDGPTAAGIYAAAYRIIDVAFTPVRALLNAVYPEFFRRGASGLRGTLTLTRKLAPVAWGYALAATACLVITAPLLPVLLGREYDATVSVLRWLSLLPFLKAVQYFFADALTGAGHQRIRSRAQIAVAGVNIALNLALIPAFSVRGAVWASLLSDALLATLLCVVAWTLLQRESRSQTGGGAVAARNTEAI